MPNGRLSFIREEVSIADDIHKCTEEIIGRPTAVEPKRLDYLRFLYAAEQLLCGTLIASCTTSASRNFALDDIADEEVSVPTGRR